MTPLYNIDVFDNITRKQYRMLYYTEKDMHLLKNDKYRIISIEKLKMTLEDYKDELAIFCPNGVVSD